MPEEPKSLIDDRERLERYLVWRETDRLRRRRRIRNVLVVAAVGVVGVGVVAWLFSGPRHTALRGQTSPSTDAARVADRAVMQPVTLPEPESRSSTVRATEDVQVAKPAAAPPPVFERAPAAPRAPKPAARRTAPATSRTVDRTASRAPVSTDEEAPPSAAPHDRSALAASTAPSDTATPAEATMPAPDSPSLAPPPPVTQTPTVTQASPADQTPPISQPASVPQAPPVAEKPSMDQAVPVVEKPSMDQAAPVVENPSVAEPPPVVQNRPVAGSPARGAPGDVISIASKPDCSDLSGEAAPDGRTRTQRVADCVGGWVKGEAREFRDGVKRNFDEFRGGIDKVGRGLQWLG